MSIWDTASVAITAAFADPELVVYTSATGPTVTIGAVRGERDLANGGRGLVYEFRAADLPADPAKQDSFTHRRRRWRIVELPRGTNPAGGWELGVADDGAAA